MERGSVYVPIRPFRIGWNSASPMPSAEHYASMSCTITSGEACSPASSG